MTASNSLGLYELLTKTNSGFQILCCTVHISRATHVRGFFMAVIIPLRVIAIVVWHWLEDRMSPLMQSLSCRIFPKTTKEVYCFY